MEDKNESPDGNWDYSPEGDADQASAENAATFSDVEPIEWSASEYIAHEKSIVWYLMLLGGSALAVLIIYFITKDLLASAAVLISCVVISIYAGRPPATKQYKIDAKGVKVNLQVYPFSKFRSFAVVEEGALDSVWLIPLKRIAPPVVMYFSPEDEDHIVNVLASVLPIEQRELDTVDKLSKILRF